MRCDELFGPVQQWGYLVKDLDAAMDCWVNQIGVGPFWGFRNVSLTAHYQGQQSEVNIDVGLAYQNGVQIELIQQNNPEVVSPYSEFYKTEQNQLFQQFGYYCLDIDQAVARAHEMGLNELGFMESAMQTRYYYFDSPQLEGMMIELMQIDDAMLQAFKACSDEADQWDGSEPYRLISL